MGIASGTDETGRSDIVVQAVGIGKSYLSGSVRLDVLKDISLSIHRGEIIAILGASGVGKSTLLHILGTLDRPSTGTVVINGTDLFSLSEEGIAAVRNKAIGFVFQAHHLLPEFTALENVMMPLLIGAQSWSAAKERATAILGAVGLSERLNHKPGELSGGEQQRVAVARALSGEPEVVLADEPSGNLDRSNGAALLEMIWELSRKHHQAFVIVTHDESIGLRADRTLRLVDGRLNDETTDKRI